MHIESIIMNICMEMLLKLITKNALNAEAKQNKTKQKTERQQQLIALQLDIGHSQPTRLQMRYTKMWCMNHVLTRANIRN